MDLIRFLNYLNCEITFIDADESKQDTDYFSHTVLSPEQFFVISKEKHIVIVTASHANTEFIIKKLVASGYGNNVNCFTYQAFLDILPIVVAYANDKNFFDSISFLATTKCNLNCYACLNFNSYNKNKQNDSKNKKELLEFRLGYTEKDYVDFCKRCSGLSININKNFVEVAKQITNKCR